MIKSLDIEPTTICNLKCPFCFGPKVVKKTTELDIEIWKDALLKFKNQGVQNVVISGGEPLLYENILDLVKFLKKSGFNIVVSTHGRFKQKVFEIAPYCDWISLPIDGFNQKTISIMRTDNYNNNQIIMTADELKKSFANLKIKIGTVVTRKNMHEILSIGKFLEKEKLSFDTWKIYEYTPRRKFKDFKDELCISTEKFNSLCIELKNLISKDIRVVFSSIESRRNAYTFIYHNGDVNLVNVGKHFGDLKAGNIQNFDDIDFQKIYSILNSNHISNFDKTY